MPHSRYKARTRIFEPAGQHFVTPVPDPVTRVVVIGAGFSGVAAANALQTRGVEVVILESRPNIGGRTQTVSMRDAHVETGGAWIHTPINNPLSELANFLSLEQKNFPLSEIFSNLRLVDHQGHVLSKMDRDRIMELANTIEEELMESAASYAASPTIAELIELRLLAITDPTLCEWVRFVLYTGFETDLACPAEDISIANYAGDVGFSGGDDCIVDGYSAMLGQLAKGIKIHCNAVVNEVVQTTAGVTVRCTNGHIEQGSHVVLSVPLGVLKAGSIRFTPDLSTQKQLAIERLGFGAFEKLILQFEHAFWRDIDTDVQGLLIKGHPVFPYWIDVSANAGHPTLAAHVSGPPAWALAELSRDTALDLALSALSKAFGGANVEPVASYQTNWLGDSSSRGGYTHLPPSITAQEIQQLSNPEARLLFAGEATSTQRFGYVDGAYISGLREAQRLTGGTPIELSTTN